MPNTDPRQTRRQDVVNGVLMIIGGSALAVMAAVLGYLLMEDRSQLGNFQKEVIAKIDSLEDQVTRLEVKSAICDCRINSNSNSVGYQWP